MACAGVEDQLGVGNSGCEQPVVCRRIQLIQRAVSHQCRDPQLPDLSSGGILSRQPLLNGHILAGLDGRRGLMEAGVLEEPAYIGAFGNGLAGRENYAQGTCESRVLCTCATNSSEMLSCGQGAAGRLRWCDSKAK